jgi:hypothetical protein
VATAVTSGGTRGVPVPIAALNMKLIGAMTPLEQYNLVQNAFIRHHDTSQSP